MDSQWANDWNKAQTSILLELKHFIPNSKLCLYSSIEDGQVGAYLLVVIKRFSFNYRIEIDISDVKTMKEFLERKEVGIEIYHIFHEKDEDGEDDEFYNSGYVNTMEEAAEIVKNIQESNDENNKFDDAMRLLYANISKPEEIEEQVNKAKYTFTYYY